MLRGKISRILKATRLEAIVIYNPEILRKHVENMNTLSGPLVQLAPWKKKKYRLPETCQDTGRQHKRCGPPPHSWHHSKPLPVSCTVVRPHDRCKCTDMTASSRFAGNGWRTISKNGGLEILDCTTLRCGLSQVNHINKSHIHFGGHRHSGPLTLRAAVLSSLHATSYQSGPIHCSSQETFGCKAFNCETNQ